MKDAGGYQAYGMPVAGAMDRYAYRVANLLVGNDAGAAVVEMTIIEGIVSIWSRAGSSGLWFGDIQGKLNGEPIDNWSSFIAPKGILKSNLNLQYKAVVPIWQFEEDLMFR